MTGWSFGSRVYGSAWCTPELRSIFDDEPRTRRWLEILAVLAEVQAAFDLIPADSARQVAATCRNLVLDEAFFDEFRAGYEASGHSTAGLIEAVSRRCPGTSGEWFYYGVTVQDVTDTWLMLALREARERITADLDRAIAATTRLCREHRGTVMPGRTHGQQGLPITFGFKAAGWLVELRRHRQRFAEVAARMDVGQICGGVGSLSSLGPRGLELQQAFCQRLGLRVPAMSWTVSRDPFAEWAHLLVLVTGTADRVGHEVYTLQRDEIRELSEGAGDDAIGSITMPHKRNPEISEHLGTLARVVRANASMLDESLVHDHERDGRSWKVEWHAVPELTMAAGKAASLLAQLLERLEVHGERMRANLDASDGFTLSEIVMLSLATRLGKQTAHRLVHRVSADARRRGLTLKQAVLDDAEISACLSAADVDQIFDVALQTGHCAALVDRVLEGER